MSAQCKSCGAPILWARTSNRKAMPLNLPGEARFSFRHDVDGNPYCVLGDTYISHFATCPNAAEHRSKP